MLACTDSHESPLVRVKHDFREICVTGLGEGDEVWLDSRSGASHSIRLQAGVNPFPKIDGLTHFVIRKESSMSKTPTTVEVLRGAQ